MGLNRRQFLKGIAASLGMAALVGAGGLVGPDGVTPLSLVADAAPGDGRRAPRRLLDRAARAPEETLRVIIRRRQKNRRIDDDVKALGHRKLREFKKLDGFVAEIKGKDLDRLARHASVHHISLDSPLVLASTPVDTSRLAPLYPAAAGALGPWAAGITGAGIGVAVFDTGINARGDFTNTDGSSRIIARVQYNADPKQDGDGYGHGTHVAGIVAGNSWGTDGATTGKYLGIAPGANLIDVKVSDKKGASYTSDMVEAIEWVIANRVQYNIRVMNMSLVQAEPESYQSSILAAAVEMAWLSGIFVVVSAGNAGPNTALYPPANDPFVMTVGATDVMNSADVGDDTLAPWSSFGLTQDGLVKPDLVAPGRHIIAPLSKNSDDLFKSIQDRIVDTRYVWLSGTSMAAPVVAGVAALLFQQHPEWTNDQVKWLLLHTARPLALPGTGAGAVRAAAALAYSGVPASANQNLTLSAHLAGPDGATTYTSSSWSSSSWSSSSWSSSSWSSSSWSSSSWSSSSWSSSSWSTAKWERNPQ